MVAAGKPRLPRLRRSLGLRFEEGRIEFVKTRLAQFQLGGGLGGGEFASAVAA